MELVAHTPKLPSAPELNAIVLVATSKPGKSPSKLKIGLPVVVPIKTLPFPPIVIEPIVEVPDVPVTVMVEDARRLPDTWKFPATVEEALEINPPYRLERLATSNVEEALNGPLTWKGPETVLEAVDRKPFENVAREEKFAKPVTLRMEANVEEAEEMNPAMKLEIPPKNEELETRSWEVDALPVTAR